MKFLLATILIFGILLIGCDIFETRDAESPERPRSNFNPSLTPEDLISNLKNSFEDKSIENYLYCFVDSSYSKSVYYFNSSGGTIFPAGEQWGIKEEKLYFENLLSKIPQGQIISILFNNETFGSPIGDSLLYNASYLISLPEQTGTIPLKYSGEIRLQLERDSRSIWAIKSWQDIKNSENATWSDLKGYFY